MAKRDFIGRGWRFPFQFDPRTGGVSRDGVPSNDQQRNRVRMSITQIIGVRKGEMFMVRRFGSSLRDLIFAANDVTLSQLLEFTTLRSLEDPVFGEKRVLIDQVRIAVPETEPSKAEIFVRFTIRATNIEGNLVYPLYLQETERLAAESALGEE